MMRPAILVLSLASIAASPRDELTRARQEYNLRQYDAAIAAATRARLSPKLVDAATLVLARAHLERFRQSSGAADLTAARDALRQIHPAQLTPAERTELLVGLGVSLYLDDRAGAAAEQFELALARIEAKDSRTRERVLDWWASALDHQAQRGPESEQRIIYARVVARMDEELGRNEVSSVASYWLVAAARGAGDLERAWGAATAVWVRASLAGAGGTALLVDLDRIVRLAIIPERAQQSSSVGDVRQTAAVMLTEWEAIKQSWSAR